MRSLQGHQANQHGKHQRSDKQIRQEEVVQMRWRLTYTTKSTKSLNVQFATNRLRKPKLTIISMRTLLKNQKKMIQIWALMTKK